MKICTRCNKEKELDLFVTRKRASDGKASQCKECHVKHYKGKNKYKNIEGHKSWQRQYREENKQKLKSYYTNWYLKNKERLLEYQKNHRKANSVSINSQKRIYRKNRLETDDLYKCKQNLRNRMAQAFRKTEWKKEGSQKLIGCSYDIAKSHIEKQFIDGMSWSNHGIWHIDHIIPLSSAKSKDELVSLCHYTNLQPLWAIDNLKKGCA
jgi:hypothetical protein